MTQARDDTRKGRHPEEACNARRLAGRAAPVQPDTDGTPFCIGLMVWCSGVAMNLLFRLCLVAAAALFHGRRPVLCASRLRLRVLPNDLDLNLHMNNARYLSMFDLGKIDVMIRSGVAGAAYRRRWRPLIGGNVVRHRFGLRPFCRFRLTTRVLCWDDRWFYFQHEVATERGVAALGLSRALLREADRSVPPEEVLATIGSGTASPPMPRIVAEWLSLDEALRSDGGGGSPPPSRRQSPPCDRVKPTRREPILPLADPGRQNPR